MRIPAPARGYTIVELMMAITVLAIGVSGIIAMQKITVASNLHAKKLAIATQIARAWQDRLAVDASLWNHHRGGEFCGHRTQRRPGRLRELLGRHG